MTSLVSLHLLPTTAVCVELDLAADADGDWLNSAAARDIICESIPAVDSG